MLNDVEVGNAASGCGIEHLQPEGTTLGNVELSIVIPAMNEEVTVGEFIEWCKEGLKRAGVVGQILIVDSSTDNTPKIVLEHGGEVLRTPMLPAPTTARLIQGEMSLTPKKPLRNPSIM